MKYDNISDKEVKETLNEPKEEVKVEKKDETFVPRKTPFTSEMAKYGLTKYDIENADRYWNETQGGKLIPHEETIQDLKDEISKYGLFDSLEDLEKVFAGEGHIGAKYLTDEEKQQVRDYFNTNYKSIETKTFEEVKDKSVQKVASEIDKKLASKYKDLYKSGYAKINVKPAKVDGYKGYKIEFNAELDYDEMEKMMNSFDEILRNNGFEAFFEMEDTGRAYAYIFK